jgi:hypothetical protein
MSCDIKGPQYRTYFLVGKRISPFTGLYRQCNYHRLTAFKKLTETKKPPDNRGAFKKNYEI